MTAPARRLLWVLACISLRAGAVEVEDGKLSINGFGSWGYGVSTNGNSYDIAQPDGHFADGEFAFALSSRLSDKAVAAAQVQFQNDRRFVIDFAFGEWRFSDLARLRVGVVKHPFGIFAEVPRVGTLRPFFLLPAGIYRDSELAGSGLRGASLSGTLPAAPWRVGYDLYFGSLALPVSNVVDKLTVPGILRPGGVLVTQSEETKYNIGGRLVLTTPMDGFDVRLSVYGTPLSEKNGPRLVGGPSLQYVGEKLTLRAEYFFFYEQGPTERDQQRTHAAYAEVAYFVSEKIQLGARAEVYQQNLVGITRASYLEHRELAGTLNYWLDPGLVLKLSLHAIDGNRFSNPLLFDDALLGAGFERFTLALISGVQFSF